MKKIGVVVIILVAIICSGIVFAGKWAERWAGVKDFADRKVYDVGTALHLRKKYQYNPHNPTMKNIIDSRHYRLGQSRKEAYKKTERSRRKNTPLKRV